MIGQLIDEGQLVPGNNSIDLSGLAVGVYPLSITDAAGHTTDHRLVKK
jgi:hypothetical protein